MRTIVKLFAVGLALSALIAGHPRANAQPLVGTANLTDSRSPNYSWKLYSGSFHAGDSVRVEWYGFSYLRLSVYDRLSNQPIRDLNGNPIVLNAATWAWPAHQSLTLTMPVDAPDAILVVKNPSPFSGNVGTWVYTYNALKLVAAPLPYVPGLNIDRRNGSANVSYQVLNPGSLPAYNVRSDISYKYPGMTTPIVILNNVLRGYTIAPSSSAWDSFSMPDISSTVNVQVSNTTYGEKFVVSYNFAM